MFQCELTSQNSLLSQSRPAMTLLERFGILRAELQRGRTDHVSDRDDVSERSTILEFDGGCTRDEADKIALAEFGFGSWEALALAGSSARSDRP